MHPSATLGSNTPPWVPFLQDLALPPRLPLLLEAPLGLGPPGTAQRVGHPGQDHHGSPLPLQPADRQEHVPILRAVRGLGLRLGLRLPSPAVTAPRRAQTRNRQHGNQRGEASHTTTTCCPRQRRSCATPLLREEDCRQLLHQHLIVHLRWHAERLQSLRDQRRPAERLHGCAQVCTGWYPGSHGYRGLRGHCRAFFQWREGRTQDPVVL
mmetsp:Transcript_27458/g.80138  ORF Transcript_27458/g.80138 Transcript_27458/m.80138 type:complete len:210 (-) Transcript_27458:31-660(-)